MGSLFLSNQRRFAYLQFSHPEHLPNVAAYACGLPSDDPIFVSCLYVNHQQKRGIGTALRQAILEGLQGRSVRVVETYPGKGVANNPSGTLEYWLKNGFHVVRKDEHFALVHKELRER